MCRYYDELKPEEIEFEFKYNPIYNTFIEPKTMTICKEHGTWWVIVEDYYYDINDEESRRTFAVVDTYGGLDFEEVS